MSLPRKIRYTEKRIIDGVEYEVNAISEMLKAAANLTEHQKNFLLQFKMLGNSLSYNRKNVR